jgi:hypothetical protein
VAGIAFFAVLDGPRRHLNRLHRRTSGMVYFRSRGLPEPIARDVTVVLIGALEGAFVLARTLRSTEPLLAAGRVLAPQYRGVALAAGEPIATGGVSVPGPVVGGH